MEVAIGEGRTSFNMEEGMAWRDQEERDMDQSFKELIEKDRVFTCEKHFAAEDIEICHGGVKPPPEWCMRVARRVLGKIQDGG